MRQMKALDPCDLEPGYATTVPDGSPTPLNCEKLLSYFGDQPSTIAKLLALFTEEARADMADLVKACKTMNSARIASLAHRVKGAAGSIGAEPLRVEAAHLETLGRSGELKEAGDCIARMQVEFEAFSKYVAELMQKDLSRNG
jgi:HPt (histidine-containing phosphotransfer) domain-containing protein